MFPILGEDSKQLEKEVNWNVSFLLFRSSIKQWELEVQNIIYLQRITNKLSNTFPDIERLTRSYMSAENAPIQVNVPVRQSHVRSVIDKLVPKMEIFEKEEGQTIVWRHDFMVILFLMKRIETQ